MDQLVVELASLFTLPLERFEHMVIIIAIGMGLAWGSGINLYATLVAVGLMALFGHAELPNGLELLENHILIAVAGVMYITEFFVSRTVKDDTGWDVVHTFIYIPAGGMMAAGAVAGSGIVAVVGIGVAGAFLTHLTHNSILGAKHYLFDRGEIFSPAASSMVKDIILLAGLWTGFHFPMLLITLLIGFIIFIYS